LGFGAFILLASVLVIMGEDSKLSVKPEYLAVLIAAIHIRLDVHFHVAIGIRIIHAFQIAVEKMSCVGADIFGIRCRLAGPGHVKSRAGSAGTGLATD
jgi:hypothetical protein